MDIVLQHVRSSSIPLPHRFYPQGATSLKSEGCRIESRPLPARPPPALVATGSSHFEFTVTIDKYLCVVGSIALQVWMLARWDSGSRGMEARQCFRSSRNIASLWAGLPRALRASLCVQMAGMPRSMRRRGRTVDAHETALISCSVSSPHYSTVGDPGDAELCLLYPIHLTPGPGWLHTF